MNVVSDERTRPRISAVIPTHNRPDSLIRLLQSLEHQTIVPDEVIIVDSSDDPLRWDVVRNAVPRLTIRGFRESIPSVCAQRNRGVREATGDYIFFCDDDMEAGPDYAANLSEFLHHNDNTVIVSGMIFEPGISESEAHPMPPLSFRGLLWKTLFLQSVWADLERISVSLRLRWAKDLLMRYYRQRKNTFTAAGWPLVTNLATPSFETAVYGLGASMMSRKFILAHPFSTALQAHGIGDHYGLAVRLLALGKGIVVLRNTTIRHNKSPIDRIPAAEAYYWRVMALDFFLDELPGWHIRRRVLLLWSLLGNFISFAAGGEFQALQFSWRAFVKIFCRRNPCRRASRMQEKPDLSEGGLNLESNKAEIRS